MAIEAIANPKMAYQGSVPKADTSVSGDGPKKISEPLITEVKAPEEPVKVNVDKYKAAAAQKKTTDKNDANASTEEIECTSGNEAMRKAVDEINRHIKNSEVVFGIHEKTNRVTIKIVDKDSGEIMREFPPEQTLDTIAKIWENAGIMVDEKR